MSALFEALVAFLDEDTWPFVVLDNGSALRLSFQGDNGQWACYARLREEQQQCVFYSVCQASAPPEKHAAIAELITRANFGLPLGNFELDYQSGAIRFKTSIDVEGDRLTPALARHLVYSNVTTMDRYLPAIMRLLESEIAPAEAIAEIEG